MGFSIGAREAVAPPTGDEVLEFWFKETSPEAWWKSDPAFDEEIGRRFGSMHEAGSAGELYEWRSEPRGRLAEIIVLDQFSRNIHRGSPRAFASDPMALALAQEAVAGSYDMSLSRQQRVFLYLPFMHSESRLIHERAERLFAFLGLEQNYEFELKHKAIIDRFGRYPHRNAVLGRESTPEELAFLELPGSSFWRPVTTD
ncbi:MAG: DUF924 family protein [Steroidobacteraceae bacterium]